MICRRFTEKRDFTSCGILRHTYDPLDWGLETIMNELRDTFKARSAENWEAAVASQDNQRFNAAANRYYYAVYQAVVYWADQKKLVRCDKSHAGFHQTLPELLAEHGGDSGKDFRDVFADVYALRLQADYKPNPVAERHLRRDLIRKADVVRKSLLKPI